MEVRADITAADCRALQQHAARRRPNATRRLPFWATVVAWLALTVVFTWLYTATTLRPGYILSAGVGFAIALIAAVVVARLTREPSASPALGARTITVDDSGMRVRSEDLEVWLGRGSFLIEETDEHLFVVSNHLPPVIVPKRSFASADEAAAFTAAVRGVGAI